MAEVSVNTGASSAPLDKDKRNWMVATAVVGGAGVTATAVPFVSMFTPSERAKAAGASVEVDVSALKPGEKLTVEWRGKPVWILKRSPEQIAALPKHNDLLADPLSKRKPGELTPVYARNENRSIKPDTLVVVGICSHLGCSPSDKLTSGPQPSLPDNWAVAFCAPAMALLLTWLAGFTKTSPPQTILKFPRICTFQTPGC